MGTPIAVLGCVLITKPLLTPPDTITITSNPSQKVMADGKPCYSGPIDIAVNGASDTNGNSGFVGKGKIINTAKKVMIDGKPCVLMGDKAVFDVKGVTSVGAPITYPVEVSIVNAGQTKVLGS